MPDVRDLRRQEIRRIVNERALTTVADRKATHCDPLHHAQISTIRDLLTAADLAMMIEDIPRETRDRVIHTLIFGEPPAPNPWPDPEAALQRITVNERLARELMTARPTLTFPAPDPGDNPRGREQA